MFAMFNKRCEVPIAPDILEIVKHNSREIVVWKTESCCSMMPVTKDEFTRLCAAYICSKREPTDDKEEYNAIQLDSGRFCAYLQVLVYNILRFLELTDNYKYVELLSACQHDPVCQTPGVSEGTCDLTGEKIDITTSSLVRIANGSSSYTQWNIHKKILEYFTAMYVIYHMENVLDAPDTESDGMIEFNEAMVESVETLVDVMRFCSVH